jgi:DNA polymerase-3 subunit chi
MIQADFYVLPGDSTDARRLFLCKLAEKIYRLGKRIYIHASHEGEALQLDQRLWDFREDSFLPHSLVSENLVASLEIGFGDTPPSGREVLINLTLQAPPFTDQFKRIIEIVIQDSAVLKASRNSYQHYKALGYAVRSHDMRKQPRG